MKKIILFLIAFLLLITACSKENSSNGITTIQGDFKEFKITAKQFAFEPEIIEVNKGDRVRLIVTSTDVPHGIGIPEMV